MGQQLTCELFHREMKDEEMRVLISSLSESYSQSLEIVESPRPKER